MRRRAGAIIALLLFCLGGVIAMLALYSVTQVLTGLRRQPAAWLDRPIRVRGLLYLCPPTSDCAILGSLADEHTSTQRVYLVDAIEPPALGAVRRVPLLNLLLPPILRARGGETGHIHRDNLRTVRPVVPG